MKTYYTGGTRRGLTAVLSVFIAVVGLGLLGYTLLSGGSPASAAKSKFAPEPPAQTTLKLTVPEMKRVEDVPVYDGSGGNKAALRNGTLHVKGTGYPWQRVANVYIAGHRLGYVGTPSWLAFWDLNNVETGDKIYVTDSTGRRYVYRVYKEFIVDPQDVFVTRPLRGRNVLTLQTCTLPDYSRRLIVQAERVEEPVSPVAGGDRS
jgi:sortase A